MDFTPSRADQCIWLKKNTKLNLYEYIAVYVDDLCIAVQGPKEIISILRSKHKQRVQGDGPLSYHLGAGIISNDIPDPLDKPVTTTTTVDANLNHCLATGRSVTGCLHFVDHTPIDSYSKR